MQPSLVIIGLNFRTASLEVRERFWIGEARRYDALHQLVHSEGIDEAVVISTPYRSEFVLWANDASSAANSVLRFLTREYNLKLCEWSHFYRLLDDAAITHLFRLASALDTVAVGEVEILPFLTSAWEQAQKAGTLGRFLGAVLEDALGAARRVLTETPVGALKSSTATAAVELARTHFPHLGTQNILVFGSGRMGEIAALELSRSQAAAPRISNRDPQRAQELATRVAGTVVPFEQRCEALVDTDILVTSTCCPHPILSRDYVAQVMAKRPGRKLVIFDLAVPRDAEPSAANIPNVVLFNVGDLERAVTQRQGNVDFPEAQAIVASAAISSRKKLLDAQEIPGIATARNRLEEVCRQELDILREQLGPFTEDQEEVLTRLASNITQRIASQLARELHAIPERAQREQLKATIDRLFRAEKPLEVEEKVVNR